MGAIAPIFLSFLLFSSQFSLTGRVIPKRHAELVSASFKRAVFTFNPKNRGLDY